MKRPHFSVRLVLLSIALVAVIISWRQAAWMVERRERLRLEQQEYGKLVLRRNELLSLPSPPASELSAVDTEMNAIAKQIEDLNPAAIDDLKPSSKE